MTFPFAVRVLALSAVVLASPPTLPTVIWHVAGEARGTPAVDESRVYFATRRHQVVAFDLDTGRERWRQSTNEQGDATFGFNVLVAGSIVAIGDYNVIGFERATGALRWRFNPSEGHAPGPYLGVTVNNLLLAGSAAGRLHAVDVESGRAVWSARVVSSATTVFQPITDGRVAYAGFTEFVVPNTGGVAAIDLASGQIKWLTRFPPPDERTLATNWAGGLVLHDNLLIAACGDGNIYALDAATGQIQWSIPRLANLPATNIVSPNRDMRPLAIGGGILVSGSLTGVVAAYDLSTRKERWRFLSQWSGSTVFRIAASETHVYVPFFSGEVVAIDIALGSEQWRIGDWKAGFIWAPLVSKDRVFVSASNTGFYSLAR